MGGRTTPFGCLCTPQHKSAISGQEPKRYNLLSSKDSLTLEKNPPFLRGALYIHACADIFDASNTRQISSLRVVNMSS